MKKYLIFAVFACLIVTTAAYAQETADQTTGTKNSQPSVTVNEQNTDAVKKNQPDTEQKAPETSKEPSSQNVIININTNDASKSGDKTEQKVNEPEKKGHSIGHILLMYIPNRIFDALDIVRARVRVGPGISAGFRITRGFEFNVGAYRTFWVGLHGPREKPEIPWPVGLEDRVANKAIFVGREEKTKHNPNYQVDEVGLDVQAAIVGASVGVTLYEICDFVTGLVFIDISGDDL